MKFSLASPLSARIRSLETNLEGGLRKLVASKHVRFKHVDGISQSSLLECVHLKCVFLTFFILSKTEVCRTEERSLCKLSRQASVPGGGGGP